MGFWPQGRTLLNIIHNNIVINISTSPWLIDWGASLLCKVNNSFSTLRHSKATCRNVPSINLETSEIKRSLEDASLTLCNGSREQKSSFSYLLADFISLTVCHDSRYLSFSLSPLQFWIRLDSKMPLRCVAPCLLATRLVELCVTLLTNIQDSTVQSVILWCFPHVSVYYVAIDPGESKKYWFI